MITTLQATISLFVFIFGMCIGSFLNCVIYRLEQSKSLKGRSFCPHCKHTLSWKDLFPIFSFLLLRGKCRYCRKNISIQYPLAELATGILFVLIFLSASPNWPSGLGFWSFARLCFMFYVSYSMIIIFVYDLKHYLIPDKVLFPAIIITFIYKFFENLAFSHWDLIRNLKLEIGNSASVLNLVLAVVIASGFFFAIWLVSRGKWMGFGDVKLAVLMGLLLGLPNVLLALFLAFLFGAIIGVMLMVFDKKNLKSEIPFGPFLIIGTFIAMLWSPQIINWYFKLFI
ncbi:MAG: prepilin peptidase [Candidatus Staskawiczbacteria bacterium]|nr:prepilin peptidase [Candidatus Staskawiczbacteria bacterium]